MPVGHVGLSRGPRPFPNGFRTGTPSTPTPPTPTPGVTVRTTVIVDNRRRYVIHWATYRTDNRRTYKANNRHRYVIANRSAIKARNAFRYTADNRRPYNH